MAFCSTVALAISAPAILVSSLGGGPADSGWRAASPLSVLGRIARSYAVGPWLKLPNVRTLS